MLVAVGVEDLPLKGIEVFLAEAPKDAGFEAKEAEDCGEGRVSRDEFLDSFVLGGGVCAGDEVLLDFEDAAEGFGVEGLFFDFLSQTDLDFQALLLGLVRGELGDEVTQLRGAFCDVPAFVVALEAFGHFVEEAAAGCEVGVAELGVEFVGGVELDFALAALLRVCCGVLLRSWGWPDDGGVDVGLVMLDAEELVDEAFIG